MNFKSFWQDKSKSRKLFADLALILGLIIVALSVFLIISLTSKQGAYVSVRINNGEAVVYSLAEDGEYVLNGGANVLVIKGGAAYMKEADCPDRTCVLTGGISKTNEKIVCLPNKISITVLGANEEVLR